MIKIIPRFFTWPHQVFILYRFRLEYGNQKVIVCHISKNKGMDFYKTYKETFELSQLEKYGFSMDLYGESLAEHKIVTAGKYALTEDWFKRTSREIVFVLKDGRRIIFDAANFTHGQLHGLVSYIEENTKICPTGRLARSLLTAKFSEEKIDYVMDMIQFSKDMLQDTKFQIHDTYFTGEAVVILRPERFVYLPYDKLLAVSFYAQTRNTRGVRISHSGFSCCWWLKNGERFGCEMKSVEDFEKIADYMQSTHPEIEADAELIYEGIFY